MKTYEKTKICGTYDPSTGQVSINFCGDNFSICALIGAMIRHIADEWGKRIGNKEAGFARVFVHVMEVATQDAAESVMVDLSALHEDKED